MKSFELEFERPVTDLEKQIEELEKTSKDGVLSLDDEIKALKEKSHQMIKEIYGKLSVWQRTQLARHPMRPKSLSYIHGVFTDFYELHGDRSARDDRALVGGLAYFKGRPCMVLGIEKGEKTQDKILRNFGMVSPEGYKKSLRLMQMAQRFRLPIFCFIDTPGAYPGIEAEKMGQSYHIAHNLEEMFRLKTPIISVVIGEGGSGGALALGIADRVLMLEHAIYSVISPESCASILWSDPKKSEQAAEALKCTAHKAYELGAIDAIISEPAYGAHKEPGKALELVSKALEDHLNELLKLEVDDLLERRFQKFRKQGIGGLQQ